jgi:hypothetical protein
MPRKKEPKFIEIPVVLDGGVRLTVYKPADAPDGAVRYQFTHNTFSIETGDGHAPSLVQRAIGAAGGDSIRSETNGPDHDTAELLAAKERLQKRTFTTADAFAAQGMEPISAAELAAFGDGN